MKSATKEVGMPKIENLTNRPVLLRCNSGEALHIAPRATSADIPDVEVKGNRTVEKLKDRHVIAWHGAEEKAGISEEAKTKEKVPKIKR
jgi:hypothetical protein